MFCAPPCTRTEPTSTFTRRFFVVASDPVISWVQLPPSRKTRDCCAIARGMSANNTATSLESFFKASFRFYPHPSTCQEPSLCVGNPSTWLRPSLQGARCYATCLIDLRQLRQHSARFCLDVLVLIVFRQPLQHHTHAAVSLHRFDQAQSFRAHSWIGVVHQGFQNHVA